MRPPNYKPVSSRCRTGALAIRPATWLARPETSVAFFALHEIMLAEQIFAAPNNSLRTSATRSSGINCAASRYTGFRVALQAVPQ